MEWIRAAYHCCNLIMSRSAPSDFLYRKYQGCTSSAFTAPVPLQMHKLCILDCTDTSIIRLIWGTDQSYDQQIWCVVQSQVTGKYRASITLLSTGINVKIMSKWIIWITGLFMCLLKLTMSLTAWSNYILPNQFPLKFCIAFSNGSKVPTENCRCKIFKQQFLKTDFHFFKLC